MSREIQRLAPVGSDLDQAVVGRWFSCKFVRERVTIDYRRGELAGVPEANGEK